MLIDIDMPLHYVYRTELVKLAVRELKGDYLVIPTSGQTYAAVHYYHTSVEVVDCR